MKIQLILIFLLIIGALLLSGCLDSNEPINPDTNNSNIQNQEVPVPEMTIDEFNSELDNVSQSISEVENSLKS
jgi:hypothetical protein